MTVHEEAGLRVLACLLALPQLLYYAILSFFLYYVAVVPIYNRFFHPLAKYPGPLFWTLYRWPYVLSLVRGDLAHDLRTHHDKYGKVVRVAPNELSYIDAAAWQDIYGYHKGGVEFKKNPIWAQPAPNGVPSILSANKTDHTRMRRTISAAFSVKALRDAYHLATAHVDTLMGELAKKCESQPAVLNFKDYYIWTTFDIIGDIGFGEPFNCLKDQQYQTWVSFLFSHLHAGVLNAGVNFYPALAWAGRWLAPKSIIEEAVAHHQLSVDKVSRRLASSTERQDLIAHITKQPGEKSLTRLELDSTAAALILAGAEGVSSALTATTNHLLRHPEKMKKLVHEIRSTFTTEAGMSPEALEALPYLKAVIFEGFRFTAPVPIGIPRIVPRGGGSVAGEILPEDTFIALPQFAAYRSAQNFSLPNTYIPERWLPEDSPLLDPSPGDPAFTSITFQDDDRSVLQPFSVGPRDCLGKGLGILEVRQILARMLWNFDLALPPDGYHFVPFEEQKTFALWQRQPMFVQVTQRRKK